MQVSLQSIINMQFEKHSLNGAGRESLIIPHDSMNTQFFRGMLKIPSVFLNTVDAVVAVMLDIAPKALYVIPSQSLVRNKLVFS